MCLVCSNDGLELSKKLLDIIDHGLTCDGKCKNVNCLAYKYFAQHILDCSCDLKYGECNVHLCYEGKKVLRHYIDCNNNTCQLCTPMHVKKKHIISIAKILVNLKNNKNFSI